MERNTVNDLEQPERHVRISETIIHRSPTNDRDEHQEQTAVIGWAKRNEHKYPALRLLYAIPNQGARSAFGDGMSKKREGLRTGVPDLHLPVARRRLHGLWIELKKTRNPSTLTNPQREWLLALEEEGHAVAVCYGAAAAIEVLEQYLNG